MRANESNPDPCTSAVVAEAVVLALLARERHGVGQAVHVNMLTANMYVNADDALDYAGKAVRPAPDEELTGLRAGYRLYRTGAGWLFLAVDSDDEWRRCWRALGAPDHASDARFATPAARAANDAELSTLLADLLGKRPAEEWEQRMVAERVAGVRADASTPGPFFAHHEQVLANELSPECTHARFGTHRRWGPIVRVNGGGPAGPGVLAGEHTDVILAALGRTPDDIAALRAARVVASEPVVWEA
jgi:crotonobetainyl-CoA:carnitine CoA-transferase CaiB-like acyl-CoA transferase